MLELQQHPLSAIFPPMTASEYDSLCASVAKIGILNPIVLYDGMIIDGWHRYRASLDEMVSVPSTELASDIDPQEFVFAQNKDRRHLTQSQYAMIAVKANDWLENGHRQGLQATSALNAQVKSSAQIAKIAGVSTRTIAQAKKVETEATPEIKKAVNDGAMSLTAAVSAMQPLKAETEPPVYSELDKLKDENAELKEIIEGLQYDISVAAYEGAEPIAEIVKELRIAKANLKQITISRNSLQNELNFAKKQILAQRKALDLLK